MTNNALFFQMDKKLQNHSRRNVARLLATRRQQPLKRRGCLLFLVLPVWGVGQQMAAGAGDEQW